jgi:hypothetical protein
MKKLFILMLATLFVSTAAQANDKIRLRSKFIKMNITENGKFDSRVVLDEDTANGGLRSVSWATNKINLKNLLNVKQDISTGGIQFYPANNETLPQSERSAAFPLVKGKVYEFGPFYTGDVVQNPLPDATGFTPNCIFSINKVRGRKIQALSTLQGNAAECRGKFKVLRYNPETKVATLAINMKIREAATGRKAKIRNDVPFKVRVKATVD